MKRISIILSLVACISTFFACATEKRLRAYRTYYQATEILLDSLEEQFNWIDKYDPGEALDNYNLSKNQLKP